MMSLQQTCVRQLCVVLGCLLFTTIEARRVLKFGAVEGDPFMYSDSENYTGYIPELLAYLSERLDYDFQISPPADGKHGSPDSQGNWSGMVGELISETIDVAGPLIVSWRRDAAVKFTQPIMIGGHAIVLKRPTIIVRSTTDDLTRLLHPIEFPVWLMTVLAFMVTSTVLYIIAHFNPYEWRRMGKDKEATIREAESFTCLNSFWFVISTLAWQGYVRAPRSMGGRITVTAWWFFVIIFILSYTACLTNYLQFSGSAVHVEDHPRVHNLQDLLDNENVRIATLPYSHTFWRFKYYEDNTDGYMAEVFDRLNASIATLQFNTTLQGIELLRAQETLDLAILMDSPTARYLVHREPCDLYMVNSLVGSNFMALASNNETLRQELDIELAKLRSEHVLQELEKKWFDSECGSFHPDIAIQQKAPTYVSMDLSKFSGALCILAFGVVLGGVVSIVEYCVYTCAESQMKVGVQMDLARQKLKKSQTLQSQDDVGLPSNAS